MSRLRCPSLVLVFACCLACKADKADGASAAEAKESDAKAAPAAGEGDGGSQDGAAQEGEGEVGTGAETGGTETETGEDELAPAPASFDEVGVEVCDRYVADYVACIDAKVPEADRDAQRRLVNENVQAWKQMASGGSSAQKGLQTACRIAREQAKRVTADWGCEW